MNIGKPLRVHRVEPLQKPVPPSRPQERPERPAVPVRERTGAR